jgi:predicted RNA-binding protein Jag
VSDVTTEPTIAAAEEAPLVDETSVGTDLVESSDSTPEANLDDEGDIAADYIEELLDICDLDGDIDIDTRGGRAYISVNASGDSNIRVLSKPDTVNALQELTRLAVQTKTGAFSRLILDVGGSREARRRSSLDSSMRQWLESTQEKRPRRCPPCRRTSASWFTTSWPNGDSSRRPRVTVVIATP